MLGLVGGVVAVPSVGVAARRIAGGPSSRGGPEAVVRRYYRRAERNSDYTAFADEVSALAHGVSPLPAVAADNPPLYTSARRATVLDTRVVSRDVDPRRVVDGSSYLDATLTEDETEALAGDNAVVAVRLGTGDGEVVQQWFLATDDDGWGLVWVADVTPSTDGTTPSGVVRRVYRLAGEAESRLEFANGADSLTHSASIVPGAMRRPLVGDTVFEELRRGTLRDTEVVARNVGPGAVTNRLGGDESAPQVRSVAEENAVVDATVEYDQVGETTREWLLATEAGEWRMVWF